MPAIEPLVSIIIPVYNSENYIAETLTSCLVQTHQNLEVIVVNDGSIDGSEAVIRTFDDPRIRYFPIGNSGSCAARNFGISQSQGELIQFLDHDDLLKRDKLECQISVFREFGEDWLYSGQMGSVSGEKCSLDEGYEIYERDFTAQQYYESVLNQFSRYMTTGAWLVSRKLLKSTHGWDSNAGLNDDGEYFMRIILKSKGIKFCRGAEFYFRRDVPGSLSKRKDSRQVFERWLYSYRSYVKQFMEEFEPSIARELSWKALSVFYCDAYPHVPDLRKQCRLRMKELGFCNAHPHGGKPFVLLANRIGTDNALRLWRLKRALLRS